MNDPHDNESIVQEMVERYAGTDDDTAEIDEIVQEIVSECGLSENSERRIREILIRRVREASNAYSYRMAREETHDCGIPAAGNPAPPPHPIAQCSLAYCGRYPGQRRDSK